MRRDTPIRSRYKKIHPCVGSVEEYKKATSPSKHNTIYGCRDESFIKEIYAIEKNAEWRIMCLKNIHDQDFLEQVAKTDTNERVRRQAAVYCKKNELMVWLKDNDPSPLVRKYAKGRYDRLPNSLKFIVS